MDSAKTQAGGQNAVAPFRELRDAPRDAPIALLHSCGHGPCRLFTSPVDVLSVPPDEVATGWERLRAFLAKHRDRVCVGYLGYDLRDATEALPRVAPDDFEVPVVHFVAHDASTRWPALEVPRPTGAEAAQGVRAHISRADYEARVAQVIEHIRAGDLFQANLTQPFTGRFEGDPRQLFWQLCAESPAPFASYLETGEGLAVLSSSPEEFLCLEGREVRTLPIKGTRPRDPDPERDRALLEELRHSGKDRAELAMIVDLMRNDLGKVAVPGSVQVGAFPEDASFAQVHHLFARVTAQLTPSTEVVDLLRATFPPGSITGAPKLRCMEILEELELVRRGVYTGAIGWIGPGSRMHLNVGIRTMVHRDGRVRFNTGGGVTAESVPAVEYQETLDKAAGMLRALRAELEG